jgi:phosphoribosylglycinamide formyltransferase-1
MAALVDAAKEPEYPAEVVLVVSNRPDAPGLIRAQEADIPTVVVDHTLDGGDRITFEHRLHQVLKDHDVQFICLAGFMRLLTPWFIRRWHHRILNIHPALLPAFKGLHTHERALQAGVEFHGATVHFVVPKMDSGPILVQVPLRVRENDSPDTLAARVLKIEHRIYPEALKLVASDRVRIEGKHCTVDGVPIDRRVLFVFGNRRRGILKQHKAEVLDDSRRVMAPAEIA